MPVVTLKRGGITERWRRNQSAKKKKTASGLLMDVSLTRGVSHRNDRLAYLGGGGGVEAHTDSEKEQENPHPQAE